MDGDRVASDRSLDMWASCGCRLMYGTCNGFQVEFGSPSRPCGGLCPDILLKVSGCYYFSFRSTIH